MLKLGTDEFYDIYDIDQEIEEGELFKELNMFVS